MHVEKKGMYKMEVVTTKGGKQLVRKLIGKGSSY